MARSSRNSPVDSRSETLRGSPEAVAKRRAARALNRLLTEGSKGAAPTDGRTERRRQRLLQELLDGTREPNEGLKPIEVLQHVHDLLELGETLASLRKAVKVHPRAGVELGAAQQLLRDIHDAYGFRVEAYEFLGLPPEALAVLGEVAAAAPRRGRPPRAKGA